MNLDSLVDFSYLFEKMFNWFLPPLPQQHDGQDPLRQVQPLRAGKVQDSKSEAAGRHVRVAKGSFLLFFCFSLAFEMVLRGQTCSLEHVYPSLG